MDLPAMERAWERIKVAAEALAIQGDSADARQAAAVIICRIMRQEGVTPCPPPPDALDYLVNELLDRASRRKFAGNRLDERVQS